MKYLLKYCLIFLALSFSCSQENILKYTVSIFSSEGGNVTLNGGTFNRGEELLVSAIPEIGYIFSNWSNGSTENPIKLLITDNVNITAIFIKKYQTKNVIVIVIDGARYSETWGDVSHKNIPYLHNEMSKHGVINTEFYNDGPTYTVAGHTSITTSVYQEIDNSGKEYPMNPSFFQFWNEKFSKEKKSSLIITSKSKLEVLDNCLDESYIDEYQPSVNCGLNGLGSSNRVDNLTLYELTHIMQRDKPNLILIQFKEPDVSGHSGDWNKYLDGIKSSDLLSYEIFSFIKENTYYKNNTSIFITNDHGRHIEGVSDGFISHGDGCIGCRHINFFAYGPDFKQGVIVENKRELIDIAPTIGELLGFNMNSEKGDIMFELFKQ